MYSKFILPENSLSHICWDGSCHPVLSKFVHWPSDNQSNPLHDSSFLLLLILSSNHRLESTFDVTGLESERSKNNATRFTNRTNSSDKPRPISIPGSLSSTPAKKSAGDARCASQDPLIDPRQVPNPY